MLLAEILKNIRFYFGKYLMKSQHQNIIGIHVNRTEEILPNNSRILQFW